MFQSDIFQLKKIASAQNFEELYEVLNEVGWDRLATVRSKEVDPDLKAYVTGCRDRVKKAVTKMKELCCFSMPSEMWSDMEETRDGILMLLDLAEEFEDIHSYTMSQRILDGSHKDLRRARAACVSMIPTSTGAAKALALVVPALKGKLDGMAVRVPTPDISLVDLTCELEKPATAEEINAALKAAHDGALHDNMGYCDEPLVSIDFKGSTHGGVVDALSTQVMDGTMAKLIIWYDNESGFTNQLARLLRKVAASL